MRPLFVGIAMIALAGCARVREPHRLPTGIVLDPAGASIALGSMPLGAIWSPDSSRIVIVLSGYRDQGIQVVDRATREVVQTIAQPAAFLGAAFSPDGGRLYVSGGNGDVVYEYAWRENAATLADSIVLAPPPGLNSGRVYPAGLACSRDGARLYVAGNLCDSLLVVDVAKRRVLARHPTGPFPYDVVVGPAGNVYVSVWGGEWIASFAPNTHGDLEARARIPAGRHPSALALDRAGRRLFAACAAGDRIAVIDTEHDSLLAQLSDAAPGGPSEGSTPNALRLSADGRRLYVAEADNDAVAVFDLGARSSGVAAATARDSLLGRIPVEWYPTAVLARGDSLFVVNGKGRGAGPNPARSQPGRKGPEDPHDYTLGQTSGSLSFVANPDAAGLVVYSRRVARAAGWDRVPTAAVLPPFRHVIYVVRENRTYDQVFGDLTIGDRDSSLTFFPRSVTPNAHCARRALRRVRPLPRECRGERRRTQLDDGCVRIGLRREDDPEQLLGPRAHVRLRRIESRPGHGRRRERGGERLLVGCRTPCGDHVAELRRVRVPEVGRPLGRDEAMARTAHRSFVPRLGSRRARHAPRRALARGVPRAGQRRFVPRAHDSATAERPHGGRPFACADTQRVRG
jgi:DNA-binding beta-propeller fold protein YncE